MKSMNEALVNPKNYETANFSQLNENFDNHANKNNAF